jgi:hypothetical protein
MLAREISAVAEGRYPSERPITLICVILQRECKIKKDADICRLISKRLELWEKGEFDLLVQEAVRANCSFGEGGSKRLEDKNHEASVFNRLMMLGKVRSAVRWITEREKGGVLQHDDLVPSKDAQGNPIMRSVGEILKEKHPSAKEPGITAMPDYGQPPLMPGLDVTAEHVEGIARKLQGGAGPGGSNAEAWQDWLLRFGVHSNELREAIAALTRRMANEIIPWEQTRALLANRLIGLDKCPGVRPIGCGEVLRRIIGKTVMSIAGADAKVICGADQLCAGLEAGIEAAVHAMNDLFSEHAGSGWGVLLVDAANAFNALNRKAALWQARFLWPRAARFLFNTYKGWAFLVLQGADEFLLSKEGTTQGDPLAMAFYAIGILPLIRSLKDLKRRTQMWYADDASAGATLVEARQWFDQLCADGPAYGYFPEPTKSFIVVGECDVESATQLFSDIGVKVVTSQRLLGGHIGSREGLETFLRKKVTEWDAGVTKLAHLTKAQPQNAYAALTKSLQCEWNYLQRVVPDCGPHFESLAETLSNKFIKELVSTEVSEDERNLYALPVRQGGLGIPDPTKEAEAAHKTSKAATAHLTEAVKGCVVFDVGKHTSHMKDARSTARTEKDKRHEDELNLVLTRLDPSKQRTVMRAKEGNTGAWLTVMPLARSGNVLSATEFRDGLALRYALPLQRMPESCDGCGARMDIQHALGCMKGGLVTRRHNEVRDEIADLAQMAYGPSAVRIEPTVREATTSSEGLRADISVRGVYESQVEASLDIRVTDTDAESFKLKSVLQVLKTHETEKKRKYKKACDERRWHFTPFVCSVDGALGKEAAGFLKRLAHKLAVKWHSSYSVVMGFVRSRLSLAILRATNLCIRGSRKSVTGVRFALDDGAGMCLHY